MHVACVLNSLETKYETYENQILIVSNWAMKMLNVVDSNIIMLQHKSILQWRWSSLFIGLDTYILGTV